MGFTTGFTVEDRHLIKRLRVSRGYGATRLCKMFPDRQWNVDGVKTLIKKTDVTGSIDRQRGSGRPRSARTPANINEVEGLTLSQEDKPQTTSPTLSTTFRRTIFRCKLYVCGLSSWLSPRPSTSLMLAGVRALLGRPLPHCRSILPVMSVFLIKVFTPSTFHCLPKNILHKRVAL